MVDRLGFPTIALFDPDDPATGHESTLRIIELGTAVTPSAGRTLCASPRTGRPSTSLADLVTRLGPTLGWQPKPADTPLR